MANKHNRPHHKNNGPNRPTHSSGRPQRREERGREERGREAQTVEGSEHKGPQLGKNCYLMFGKHPVEAALNNKAREKMNLWLTSAGRDALGDLLAEHKDIPITTVDTDTLSAMVHSDSPHQGMVMEVRRLGTVHLEEACKVIKGEANIVLALDQVTDPHNIGAIMRSAIAFGAKAIITPDRHAPPETGVLAKSAAGMLELLPWVRVTNLGNALEELAEAGYWRVGLDGDAKQELSEIDAGQNVVLVLGSEGKGMREGTQKKCDFIAKLPINPQVESLNVSNAAAVALYELGRK